MTLSVEAREQVRRLVDSASDLLKKLASSKFAKSPFEKGSVGEAT